MVAEEKEMIMKSFNESEGYAKHNNMVIEDLSEEKVVITATADENSYNPSQIIHGGLIFGLADTAMGTLAYLTGRKVVTVDANINYLKPCRGHKIKCIATPIKVGNTLGVYKADIYNEDNDLAATVIGTFIFLTKDINK